MKAFLRRPDVRNRKVVNPCYRACPHKREKLRASGLSRTSKDELLIEAMLQNPILIERPIIISGTRQDRRPPERAWSYLNN